MEALPSDFAQAFKSPPRSEINIPYKDYVRFPNALTDSGAIDYPDNYPSIEYEKGGSNHQDFIDPGTTSGSDASFLLAGSLKSDASTIGS